MRRRTLLAASTALLAGAGAYELDRQRLLRSRDADPEWWELNTPLDGRAVEVTSADGTRIHAEVHGPDDAPTVLLVPGWLESLDLWHHQIRALRDEFRVIAYDLRGHGASGLPPSRDAYTAQALGDDLQAVLQALLPAGEPCLAVGHSMGGMSIVAWAGQHPEDVHLRFAGAVLLNTGLSEFIDRATVLGDAVGAQVHRAAHRSLLATEVVWPTWLERGGFFLVRRAAFGPGASAAQVAFAHHMFVTTSRQARAGFGRLFLTLDLESSVSSLTVPAAVIAGRSDRLLPPWYAEQLAAKLPDLVEYVELSESGHTSLLEEAARVSMHIGRMARACLLVRPAAVQDAEGEHTESSPSRLRRRRRAQAPADEVQPDAASG
ncbi:MAG TPA: alpha/beta hydrolase [Candidatus Dormibacteraeota bacterium]